MADLWQWSGRTDFCSGTGDCSEKSFASSAYLLRNTDRLYREMDVKFSMNI